ncbi:MAG: hypothetical protein L6R35_006607 [Caloplaca aegaea]|nr:MAG: hypothetical protein L6R35_006607 [Caloplaca aegaea]
MVVTKEDLLAHSRYIRDTLVPRLAKGSNVVLGKSTFDLAPLRSALEELHKSPMTVEILSFSRIEKALQKIVEARGSGWPPDIVSKARDLTVRWEESLGSLQRVKTDLWGLGGRLEGLAKPGKSLWKGHANLQIPETPDWQHEIKCNVGRAHQDGHSGFQVGEDGIIDNPHSCVTSDEDVAYAITMTHHTETNESKDDSCSFTPRPNDPGAFKLMSTINGEQRNPVRVLRSWRLDSSLAPIAGLRYRVTGYGVKLSQSPGTDKDVWRYTFRLRRERCQEPMEKALAHPCADQLDDWEDFKAGLTEASEAGMKDEGYEDLPAYGRASWIPQVAERTGRIESIDSGYFSPHPEGQADMKR